MSPSDTSNVAAETETAAQAPVAGATVTTTAVTKPETWEQEAWDALEYAEQKIVSALHEADLVFTADIWPAIKAGLTLFTSQLGKAVFGAVTANILDPNLIPAAVGAAIVLTASTTGVADAKNVIETAQAAVDADPNVKAALAAQGS